MWLLRVGSLPYLHTKGSLPACFSKTSWVPSFLYNGNTWSSSGCIERNGYLGSTSHPSKSHHQDFDTVCRESLKTFICDWHPGWGVDLVDIHFSPKKRQELYSDLSKMKAFGFAFSRGKDWRFRLRVTNDMWTERFNINKRRYSPWN